MGFNESGLFSRGEVLCLDEVRVLLVEESLNLNIP